MKVYACVYGCSANVADFEIATGLLKEKGFQLVNSPLEADLSIIFTCSVKAPTVNRMAHLLQKFEKLKKPLVVAGCLPHTDPELIQKISPNASLLGCDSVQEVVGVVKETLEGKKVVALSSKRRPKLLLPRVRRNPLISIIPISIGCLSSCSYCSVKFARGRLCSYPSELIVREASQALQEGCKEIWLTSQDNACYGFDFEGGVKLPELLEKICQLEGKFWVRVGMMNPCYVEKILKELVRAYQHEKIFKFLHLPLQSGSDRILESMKRGYTINDFLSIVKEFRAKIPDLTLETDVIVGYPGEEEEDFEETLKILEKIEPDVTNVSKFGARKGTLASKLQQLPAEVIKKRSVIVSDLVKELARKRNERWVGWSGEILIDEAKDENLLGRNFAYKQVVVKSSRSLGERIKVRIVEAGERYLLAEFSNA